MVFYTHEKVFNKPRSPPQCKIISLMVLKYILRIISIEVNVPMTQSCEVIKQIFINNII